MTIRRPHDLSAPAGAKPVRQQISVGPLQLEAWVSADRYGSAKTISVSSSGLKSDGSEDWPRVTDMREVFPRDLPPGLSLFIYEPALCFSAIDGLTLEATSRHKRLTLSAGLYFDQWHLDCNLIHFASKLIVELQAMASEIEIIGTKASKNEYVGMSIEVQFALPAEMSIEEAAQLGAKTMQAAYKQTVRTQMLQPMGAAPAPEQQPLTATRWWAERFIVPVIGSGAVSGCSCAAPIVVG